MQKSLKKELSIVTGITLITVLVLVIGQQFGFDPFSDTNLKGAVTSSITACTATYAQSSTWSVTQSIGCGPVPTGWNEFSTQEHKASAAWRNAINYCLSQQIPNCPVGCMASSSTSRSYTPSSSSSAISMLACSPGTWIGVSATISCTWNRTCYKYTTSSTTTTSPATTSSFGM